MSRWRPVALCALAVLLVACSGRSNRLYLQGSGPNWEAVMDATTSGGSNGNSIEENLKVKYVGQTGTAPAQVSYQYESIPSGGTAGKGNTTLVNGQFEAKGGGGSSRLPSKSAIVRLTLEWNGKSEVLELR